MAYNAKKVGYYIQNICFNYLNYFSAFLPLNTEVEITFLKKVFPIYYAVDQYFG